MASTPFKLRSGNTPLFKAMGSSPAKHPLDREHTHPKEKKEKGPVKGPEETDVMDIIRKRKQSGPKESPENQQKEINELVEERDPTAGKGKSVAKPKKDKKFGGEEGKDNAGKIDDKVKQSEDEGGNKIKRDANGKIIKDKSLIDKVTDKVKKIYDKVTSDESVERRNRKKNRREKREKKERDRSWNSITKGPLHPDSQ